MHLKRKIHFTNEPILHFTLGAMWNLNDVPVAFDIDRFQLGLKDKACTDSITNSALIANPPTVIIILFDAMRYDHLPVYGYQRETTPFIDSLLKTGNATHVKKAFSTSNMTSGGVAGLFYSKDWEDFGYNGLSLFKFMRKLDYKTYAFLTGFHRDWYDLSAMYRSNCDYYYESALDYTTGYDDDIPTLAKIRETKIPKNSFVYIHLLSTHTIGKKDNRFRIFKPDKIDLGVSAKTALSNNHDNGIYEADNSVREIFNKLENDGLLENLYDSRPW
jgi:glucan phosphoethanolaminetransferase (alkaline phosphatase superfamily)